MLLQEGKGLGLNFRKGLHLPRGPSQTRKLARFSPRSLEITFPFSIFHFPSICSGSQSKLRPGPALSRWIRVIPGKEKSSVIHRQRVCRLNWMVGL
jgi:hypothetical protein